MREVPEAYWSCLLGFMFILAFAGQRGLAQSGPTPPDFEYSSFSPAPGLTLNGDASLYLGRLRLTPNQGHAKGSAWYNEKRFIAEGFETEFSFEMKGSSGADGFAFVVQNDDRPSSRMHALGGYGWAIGYGGYSFAGEQEDGIANSLAVEFDTWLNTEYDFNDVDANHIAVHSCGKLDNRPYGACRLATTESGTVPKLSDTGAHTVAIRYVPGTLHITLDGDLQLTMDGLDLARLLELDEGKAWVGFTAATQNAWQAHDILDWKFSIKPGIFRRGDVNEDGASDISDSIGLFTCLFLSNTDCAGCPDMLDANDDGLVNISDPIYLLNWRFSSGGSPPAPFPGCGSDPSADLLDQCIASCE